MGVTMAKKPDFSVVPPYVGSPICQGLPNRFPADFQKFLFENSRNWVIKIKHCDIVIRFRFVLA